MARPNKKFSLVDPLFCFVVVFNYVVAIIIVVVLSCC